MKLKIKGLSTEILTPVTVDCDGGEVTFTLKWMPIESKEVKTELAKLFSQSQRELGRLQLKINQVVNTEDKNDDTLAEMYDTWDQLEALSEEKQSTVITEITNRLIGWSGLTGENDEGKEMPVPFERETLNFLLADDAFYHAFVDGFKGLLGLRQLEREEAEKNS